MQKKKQIIKFYETQKQFIFYNLTITFFQCLSKREKLLPNESWNQMIYLHPLYPIYRE